MLLQRSMRDGLDATGKSSNKLRDSLLRCGRLYFRVGRNRGRVVKLSTLFCLPFILSRGNISVFHIAMEEIRFGNIRNLFFSEELKFTFHFE